MSRKNHQVKHGILREIVEKIYKRNLSCKGEKDNEWDCKNIFQWNKRVNDMEIESKKTFFKRCSKKKRKAQLLQNCVNN